MGHRQGRWSRGRTYGRDEAHLRSERREFGEHVRQTRLRPRLAGRDDQLDGTRKALPKPAKRLTRQPPQPRARRGVTDAAGDSQAEAGWVAVGRQNHCDHMQMQAVRATPATKNQIKLGFALQAATAIQFASRLGPPRVGPSGHSGDGRVGGHTHLDVETVRRRRPLARRRLSTARPFLVAMRARKPCVRTREILLGFPRPFFISSSSLIAPSRRASGRS